MGTECAGTVVEVGSSLDRKVWVCIRQIKVKSQTIMSSKAF